MPLNFFGTLNCLLLAVSPQGELEYRTKRFLLRIAGQAGASLVEEWWDRPNAENLADGQRLYTLRNRRHQYHFTRRTESLALVVHELQDVGKLLSRWRDE